MKLRLIMMLVFVFVLGSMMHATTIDNGSFTTDTKLGLDYLDVGLVHGNYLTFSSGIVYDGRTWVLATADQIASTWSDATGLNLTAANILSSDNDMGAAATNILISLFDGVTTDLGSGGERVVGDFSVDNYFNFIAGGKLAVHDVFNDSHYSSIDGAVASAWLVSSSTPSSVPEPGTIVLMSLGLLGLGAVRKMKS